MQEKEYYNEITSIIENIEIKSKVKELQDNSEKLQAYWNIGRVIVEAQGGIDRAQYGNKVIKSWALKLVNMYGKNYSIRNLNYYRKFFISFPKVNALRSQLTWTHYRSILSIKNENKRNYYINLVILNNLSSRELIKEIKNNSFDRLSYADKENIKLVAINNCTLNIEDMIKDPILINTNENINILNEKVLHRYIIEMLENKFMELGIGFALLGHEYKINVEGHKYSLDLLFFNYKINAFVVVELKTRTMKISDCDQVMFYTKLVDKYIKEQTHNKTVGLLIAKEKDKYIIKYATDKGLFAISYKIVN